VSDLKNILNEIRTKFKTTDKARSSIENEIEFGTDSTKSGEISTKSTSDVTPGKRSGKRKTRQAVSKMQGSPEAMSKLANADLSGLSDEMSNDEAMKRAGVEYEDVIPKPTKPETLPAVINKAMSTDTDIDVDWHMVKHLPGYLAEPIRALGRQVFKPFTDTPIEKIQVLAHMPTARGPNDEMELRFVASWLKRNGTRDTHAEMNFEKTIPDYDAEVVVYSVLGYAFMVVKDFMGHYIYGWPSNKNEKLTFREFYTKDKPSHLRMLKRLSKAIHKKLQDK